MKKALLVLLAALIVNISFAAFEHNTQTLREQNKAQITTVQKVDFNKNVEKIIPLEKKAYVGQYALIGLVLIILGALLFIPQLVTIIAATLIIMGVVLFVLDLIGMI